VAHWHCDTKNRFEMHHQRQRGIEKTGSSHSFNIAKWLIYKNNKCITFAKVNRARNSLHTQVWWHSSKLKCSSNGSTKSASGTETKWGPGIPSGRRGTLEEESSTRNCVCAKTSRRKQSSTGTLLLSTNGTNRLLTSSLKERKPVGFGPRPTLQGG
jgi:hypothetical protein